MYVVIVYQGSRGYAQPKEAICAYGQMDRDEAIAWETRYNTTAENQGVAHKTFAEKIEFRGRPEQAYKPLMPIPIIVAGIEREE